MWYYIQDYRMSHFHLIAYSYTEEHSNKSNIVAPQVVNFNIHISPLYYQVAIQQQQNYCSSTNKQ